MAQTKMHLLFIIVLLFTVNTVFACTTFVISGEHTPDGKPLLFKNRDTGCMDNALVLFEDGKYKYIAVVNGNENWDKEVWGGYNETGFAIVNAAAYNNNTGDTTQLKDQEGVVMKMALQHCRTLQDFERLLDTLNKPMGVDSNFGVIDASGGAAYYETGNYNYKKFDANDPDVAPHGFLVRTNFSVSGDTTKGYGFIRYNTALQVLNEGLNRNQLSPQYAFDKLSRNLYQSLTGTNLGDNLPASRDTRDLRFFIDYIPRVSTSAAMLIVGTGNEKQADEVMMWTVLGSPLCSVAVPVWLSAGKPLPRVLAMNDSLRAPLCNAALALKQDCFPVTRGSGKKYINLSAVINQEQTGYLQLLKPVENTIFEKGEKLCVHIANGTKSYNDIQAFYTWVDKYLNNFYKEKFNCALVKK
ncbi:MAG: hypothetical protein U9Q98_00465 [Bacteroidota bacterium]|nr:hypothetical protein [Bacteroidota bacterium]